MIYAVQAIILLFAVFAGHHDAPAVTKFRDHGSTNAEQAAFHSTGFKMRMAAVVMASVAVFIHSYPLGYAALMGAITGIVCALIVWCVFDIALNSRRPGISWDYLGRDNGVDRWLLDKFGKRAGQLKAFGCVVGVAAGNIAVSLFLNP